MMSEKLWIKLEIKALYGMLNRYNKELYYRHLELYREFSFIELEEILYTFGNVYITNKLKKKNLNLRKKLDKLVCSRRNKEETNTEIDYRKGVVNLTDTSFDKAEKALLAKGLKYSPPSEIDKE